MDINMAFGTLQLQVNVDPGADVKARDRRDIFRTAFGPEADVESVFPSGSLARGSQIAPIHDVDMVIVFDAAEHPTWGSPGDSAGESLGEVRERVHALLGQSKGSCAQEVRRADIKNHSLKCFLDDQVRRTRSRSMWCRRWRTTATCSSLRPATSGGWRATPRT